MSSTKSSKDKDDFKNLPEKKFEEGEKVLCYHGPLIYEAKCINFRYVEKERSYHYRIHYSGWNKSWDEWVPEVRVLKFNEENTQKQQELKKAQRAETKSRKKKNTNGKEKRGDDSDKDGNDSQHSLTEQIRQGEEKNKRRRTLRGESDEEEHQFQTQIEIELNEKLEDCLCEDWAFVNLSKKKVKLPASLTIEEVLEEYLKDKKLKDDINLYAFRIEIVETVRNYFNAMLESRLLYDVERDQFNKLMAKYDDVDDVNLCGIYGTVHLLRTFCSLGWAMGYTKFEDDGVNQIVALLKDFLSFLTSKSESYFGSFNYTSTDEDDDKDDDDIDSDSDASD